MKQNAVLSTLTAIGMMLIMLLVSCSKKESSERQRKSSPDIRREGAKTIITDESTGQQLIFGATDEVPVEFPRDIPIYPSAEINNHFIENRTLICTFFTRQSVEEVRDYFHNSGQVEKDGWSIVNVQESGLAFNMDLRKDDRRAMITLTLSKNPDGTYISYVVRVDQKPAE